jgi:hypothetical protein
MMNGMPRTELVLALYMTEQLVYGNQDFIASSHAKERCVLPMSFLEQVELVMADLNYDELIVLVPVGSGTSSSSASWLDTS